MITMLFSVYDSAAERFLEPFCAPTVEFAIRSFKEAVTRDGHQFNKFPEDYTLFKVGEYDQESGSLKPVATPQSLGVAITFMAEGPKLDQEARDA